jgi:cell division protein FtsW (lipid II flippase)
MERYKVLGFVVIAAHWAAAVWHLFVAAKVLPSPDNRVNLVAIGILSVVHLAVSVVWWKVPNRPAGLILSTFFIAVLAFGVYEHFLHPGANNAFMVLPGEWKTPFEASVVLLTALEVLGAGIGFRSLKGRSQFRGLPLAT